uniref:Uncharacterized protein n=1 Tax=Sphaerodactylus townsendi TaxID=933632 RepID=A0ACB8EPT6_9SAUR
MTKLNLARKRPCSDLDIEERRSSSFQIALHIYPVNPELWNEDLSLGKAATQTAKESLLRSVRLPPKGRRSRGDFRRADPRITILKVAQILAVIAAIAEKEKNTSPSKL